MGDEDTEGDVDNHYPPDRTHFQKELCHLNARIEDLRSKIDLYVDKNEKEGLISVVKRRKQELQSERQQLFEKANFQKASIAKLREKLQSQKKMQMEIEKDCRIRSMDKLEQYLKDYEDQYLKQKSIKTEQLLVAEIDSLKRNKIKLEKLDEILKTKHEIEAQIDVCVKEKDLLFSNLYKVKISLSNTEAERRTHSEELFRLKRALHELYVNKNSLIRSYQSDRQGYSEWFKVNKKSVTKFPSTFPTQGGRAGRNSVYVEDEELEPFYEQKRDCNRLISYLEKWIAHIEPTTTAMTWEHGCSTTDESDSADEFPSSFARMGINAQNKKIPSKRGRAKHLKPSQPLSHSMEICKLFCELDVRVPACVQDIPPVLESIRAKLLVLERATNEIDWEQELQGLGPYLTISRTVSEFTTDSACPDSASDAASMASCRNGRASAESPLYPSRKVTFEQDAENARFAELMQLSLTPSSLPQRP